MADEDEVYAAGIKDADIEKEPDMDKDEKKDDKGKKTTEKNAKKKGGKDGGKDDDEEEKELVGDEANELAKEYDDEAEQKPDRRLFKCVIKNCRLRRIGENCDPYIKFELGGNFKKEDRRHLGEKKIVKTGKHGKRFKTRKFKNAKKGSAVEYSQSFVKYWIGTYEELEEQKLKIEMWDWDMLTRNDYMGEASITLSDIADGCVQQHVEFRPSTLRQKGKRKVVSGELDFTCYFQEVFLYQLDFRDWLGRDLFAADANGTSDPFIKFSISGDVRKFFKKGGYFGRSTTSTTIMNTLFPKWDECGILHYRGTRSELESEDLHIKVYDWDRLSANDLIGTASIPIRGIVDYGFLQSGLSRVGEVTIGKKVVKRNLPAGSIEGYVHVVDLPMHQQFGDAVTLKKGHQYLAVHIVNCTELQDCEMGYSDPFVVCEWDGIKQETRVIEKELNPYFDETLYFPVRVINMEAHELEKKDPVKIEVFHHGTNGNSFLGSIEIPLYAILLSKQDMIKEFGGSKARIFRGTLRLKNLGDTTQQTISVRSYFVPELSPEIVLEEKPAEDEVKQLPPVYLERAKEWRNGLRRMGKQIDSDTFPMSALDEKLTERFLPTYLTPMIPPRELRDRMVLVRMIQAITWAEDKDIYSGNTDVWTSPNFFLNIRKGDSEDHAILMGNLLLGNDEDAYLCLGTTHSGVKNHVWIMIREGDGSVSFYETSTGKRYRLPGRWRGFGVAPEDVDKVDVDVDEFVEYSKATKKLRKKLGKEKQKEEGDAKTYRGEDLEMEKKEAGKVERVKETPVEDLVFFDDDTMIHQKDILGDLLPEDSCVLDSSYLMDDDGLQDSGSGFAPVKLPYKTIEVVFNHKNVWANAMDPSPANISFDVEDISSWHPFVTEDGKIPEPAPFYEPRPIGPRLAKTRSRAMENLIFLEIKSGYMVWRHKANMETKIINELRETLREGLEIMERLRVTNPFIVHAIREKTREVSEALVKSESELERDCLAHEMMDMKKLNCQYDLDYWRGKLMGLVPEGFEFEGTPLSFSFTDHKRIRRWIMEKYNYHEDSDDKVMFAIGVHVAPYANSVNAVNVLIAKIYPCLT